jgi:hypothetical protein
MAGIPALSVQACKWILCFITIVLAAANETYNTRSFVKGVCRGNIMRQTGECCVVNP